MSNLDPQVILKSWYVYMIRTRCGKLYTGITTNLESRFNAHVDVFHGLSNAKGAKFFRSHEPVAIVYQETCANRSDASKREVAIKKMSKRQKLNLLP